MDVERPDERVYNKFNIILTELKFLFFQSIYFNNAISRDISDLYARRASIFNEC